MSELDVAEFDVVVVGSLNMDLVVHAARLPAPGETVSGTSYAEFAGGKGLNQAVAAARSGARVALIGAVGDDAAGAALRHVLVDEGIDHSGVRTIAGEATGRALISVDDRAENSIIVIPGANASVEVDSLPTAPVVLAQLEVPTTAVESAFAAANDMGALTVLNPAPAAAASEALLRRCSVLVPNEHEVELIGGAAAISALGVEHLVITLGAAGAEHHAPAGAVHRVEPFPVTPVDTTGAGDAFCGSLAARLAAGDDMATALRFAAAAGALATTTHGAVPSQPAIGAVQALLSGSTDR